MTSLFDATRDLVDTTKGLLSTARKRASLGEIARGAGDPVEYEWLKKFAAGGIRNPAIDRVERLHGYLRSVSGKKPNKQNVGVSGAGHPSA